MATIRAAVLGRPIGHSKSPLLHRAAFAALGLDDSEYTRFDVGAEELGSFLAAHADFTGFSLTMPLKERLVDLAATAGWVLDDTAHLTGVGNTLVRSRDSTLVANTDVQGIVGALSSPLRAARARRRGEAAGPVGERLAGEGTGRAVILGAGATARSAVVACARLGVTEIDLLVRNPSRASGVLDLCTRLGITAATAPLTVLPTAEILISTLPAEAVPDLEWPADVRGGVALDVAYATASAFLAGAARRGVTPVDGTAMLVEQAVEQFVMFLAAARGDEGRGKHPGTPAPGEARPEPEGTASPDAAAAERAAVASAMHAALDARTAVADGTPRTAGASAG
ncbi:shikimate dehydrogenase [Brevibacterium sanguinis]|uniref:Shikimate dehydrogenase n=2 Tax=Brevibacterium TaxID=1696 RepID=A0A366IIF3_9MICO|nr:MULTISPECIES: shikimate dehydrogenase [Brevibacterium]RBP61574.1 shikimate dehydrogenase [Brevibacterium sanguinis]RBP70826.1 shikimate dehydrogenase [Brevibacterium celere]